MDNHVIFNEFKALVEQKYAKALSKGSIVCFERESGIGVATKVDNTSLLNIEIDIHDTDVTISYHCNSYSNYSELNPNSDKEVHALANDLFDIFDTFINEGATRIDKYVGSKLVSTTLNVGEADKITQSKAFKVFGKREKREVSYPPLIKYL